jgi:hypothetical protein
VEFRYKWKEIIFFQISSETTRVVTATVAAFDVPPQGLSRNVKYGSSFSNGKSRGATGGLNSSEAWLPNSYNSKDVSKLSHSTYRYQKK